MIWAMSQGKGELINFTQIRRRKGSDRALESVFGENQRALRAFVIQRASIEGVEVEDVVQEVFLRLANDRALLSKVASRDTKARSYLFTMANNLIVDICRKLNVRKKYQDIVCEELTESIELERSVIAQKELAVMKEVIVGLKPEWRETFVLNRFGGMSYREISEHLGITVKQVENHMAKSLIRIRKAQEEFG